MAVSGIGVAYALSGAVLFWSGFTGNTLQATLTDFLKGAVPAHVSMTTPTIGVNDNSSGSTTSSSGNSSTSSTTIPAADKAGTPTANKALGKLLAGSYGWAGSGQWPYLESGWQEESGWNQYAANDKSDPYNHAYGIPQANPGSKMSSAGSDWKTNPATQIRWGLNYIKQTYGSPSKVPGWTPNGPASGYVGY